MSALGRKQPIISAVFGQFERPLSSKADVAHGRPRKPRLRTTALHLEAAVELI